MSKALATTKYFTHASYALSPNLVNRDVLAAVPGLNFGPSTFEFRFLYLF